MTTGSALPKAMAEYMAERGITEDALRAYVLATVDDYRAMEAKPASTAGWWLAYQMRVSNRAALAAIRWAKAKPPRWAKA